MEDKMSFKKSGIIISMLLLVTLLGASGDELSQTFDGPDVDTIYANIRHAGLHYDMEESIMTFTNEGMQLVCTLTIPKAGKSCPVVITLNGFVGGRDEEPIPGTDETVYTRLCRILAGHGIASLRVDFRGYGDSDGTFDMISFSTQRSDILAAVEFITHRLKRKVDAEKIGILGFSQGGLVATITAAKDERVDSICLWSPPSYPPICYEGLLTKDGIKQGMALKEGESVSLGLYLDGVYLGWDVTLGAGFFRDLFSVNPLVELRTYKNPMMVISGLKDNIVWPQPAASAVFLKYHDGYERLVQIDADHEFDYWDGPVAEKMTDAIYWSVAWFIKTLRYLKGD
jgi:pimeloyl-ACP methyl ester carboxylesterase